MRKILLATSLLLLATVVQAQPVLDQTAVGQIGSTFYLGIQDTFSPNFGIGSAGANRTWVFDTLLVNGTDTLWFIDPSSSSYASDFPTANLAIEQASLAGGLAFLESSSAGLDLQGLVADLLNTGSPIIVHQTPASRVAQFPFTYLDTFHNVSTVDVRIDASGFGIPLIDSARTKRIQDRNLLADGYGMLNLPSGSFSNVLRVKEITLETDSVWVHSFFGWQLYQDSVYTDSTFTWWNGSKGYYLAQASYIGGLLNTIRYQDPIILAAPQPTTKSYSVYPNPAFDRVLIDADEKAAAVRITDLQGHVVLDDKIAGWHETVQVADWPRGYYLYSLIDKHGRILQSGRLLLQ